MKTNSNKKKILIIGGISLGVLALAGTAYYFFVYKKGNGNLLSNKKDETKNENASSTGSTGVLIGGNQSSLPPYLRDESVKRLQYVLNKTQVVNPKLVVDGKLGTNTKRALRQVGYTSEYSGQIYDTLINQYIATYGDKGKTELANIK